MASNPLLYSGSQSSFDSSEEKDGTVYAVKDLRERNKLAWQRPTASLLYDKTLPNWMYLLGVLLLISTNGGILWRWSNATCYWPGNIVYSPASPHIEYVTSNPVQDSSYLPPYTNASDRLWFRWENSMVFISEQEASKMDLPTMEFEKGKYVIGVDVFHQLHCLNFIRQLLYPERYKMLENAKDELRRETIEMHKGHCIESIRLSLSCSSDVTPTIFSFNASSGGWVPDGNVPHECRNFDKLEQWAAPKMIGANPELKRKFLARIQDAQVQVGEASSSTSSP